MLRLDNWHPIVCTGQNITGKNTTWLGCLWVLVGTRRFLVRRRKYSNSITTSSLMAIFCLNVGIEGILHVSFIFQTLRTYCVHSLLNPVCWRFVGIKPNLCIKTWVLMASEIDLFREGACLRLRDKTIRLQRSGKNRAKTLSCTCTHIWLISSATGDP